MIGPKCIHCKKQRKYHKPGKLNCPEGKRSGALGYWAFSETSTFEAKEQKSRGSAESRKDRKVRRWVKSQPCIACGTSGTDWNPVDPAHIRTWKVTQSDHVANLIPLCRVCHRTQHADGWEAFLANNEVVRGYLEIIGWTITPDPFQPGKLILKHPEIA